MTGTPDALRKTYWLNLPPTKQQRMMTTSQLNAANDNEAKFEDFHTKNPHVYELVKHFTKQNQRRTQALRHPDHSGPSAGTQFENSGDPFKVNNNHGRYYARKFMEDHPSMKGSSVLAIMGITCVNCRCTKTILICSG